MAIFDVQKCTLMYGSYTLMHEKEHVGYIYLNVNVYVVYVVYRNTGAKNMNKLVRMKQERGDYGENPHGWESYHPQMNYVNLFMQPYSGCMPFYNLNFLF